MCYFAIRVQKNSMELKQSERVYCMDVSFPYCVLGLAGRKLITYDLRRGAQALMVRLDQWDFGSLLAVINVARFLYTRLQLWFHKGASVLSSSRSQEAGPIVCEDVQWVSDGTWRMLTKEDTGRTTYEKHNIRDISPCIYAAHMDVLTYGTYLSKKTTKIEIQKNTCDFWCATLPNEDVCMCFISILCVFSYTPLLACLTF